MPVTISDVKDLRFVAKKVEKLSTLLSIDVAKLEEIGAKGPKVKALSKFSKRLTKASENLAKVEIAKTVDKAEVLLRGVSGAVDDVAEVKELDEPLTALASLGFKSKAAIVGGGTFSAAVVEAVELLEAVQVSEEEEEDEPEEDEEETEGDEDSEDKEDEDEE